MELLYIWIEKFRGIKDKGYNFSNQYEISYDKGENEVFIKDINGNDALEIQGNALSFINDDNYYLKDFFGSTISQITAIIGKNSSGKSNLLDFILTAISRGARRNLSGNYVLIFKKGNIPLFFGKTAGKSVNNSSLKIQQVELRKFRPEKEWETMFYSNIADKREYLFEGSTTYNFSFENMIKLQSNKIKFVVSDFFNEAEKNLDLIDDPNKKIRFVFNPNAFIELFNQRNSHKLEGIVSGILMRYNKAIYDESSSNYNRFRYSLTINLLSYLIINDVDISNLTNDIGWGQQDGYAEAIATLNPKVLEFLMNFKEFSKLGDLSKSDYKKYIELLGGLDNKSINLGEKDSYNKSIIVDLNDEFKNLIENKADLFNNIQLISHDWSQLSSGMRAYLNFFAQLYYLSDNIKNKDKNILMCIDEGDLYLHPEWQRKFIKNLIDFISKIFTGLNVQVILTSHSPFPISDLPKENVILIEKDSSPDRQLDQPSSFGANIHQLFTQQFFLSNGSIGEFAKEKIIKLLKDIPKMNDETIDIFKNKTAMIGEPVLRIRLEDEFNKRLNTLSKETQIKWHKQEIKKLEQQ